MLKLMRCLIAVIISTSLITAPASAVEAARRVHFDIPAQALSSALVQFAGQAGVQFTAPGVSLGGAKSAAVKGEYLTEEALGKLLAGTGFGYRFVDEGTVAISEVAKGAAGGITQGEWVAQAGTSEGSTADSSAEGDVKEKGGTEKLDEIIVTSTRLNRRDVPTPIMVVDSDMLKEGARANVIAALNDLPQFKASWSPQITGGSFAAGATTVNLRGFGSGRTLVLMDRKRFVSPAGGTGAGGPDLAVIPSIMLDRVDVVTDGASAAWGSGAVAGVVNLVPLGSLQGFRFGTHIGRSSRGGDVNDRQVEAAGGFDFAGGQGHVIVGGEYVVSDDSARKTSRENVGRWALTPNPASGQAPLIFASDVGFANASYGGLILTGVNAGKTFDPDGTLRPFDFGRVSGTSSIGGEGPSNDDVQALSAPYHRYSALGRVIYDLSDNITVKFDLLHSRTFDRFGMSPDANRGNITIGIDNAFLPAAIRNQMSAAGQTSFTMGRFNSDYAQGMNDYSRRTSQATLSFDGLISAKWNWNAYYGYGQYDESNAVDGYRVTANFANAVDSIINPATGQPICRIALSNPATDCVPIDVFGYGAPTSQARAYVTDISTQHMKDTLQTAGLSLQGKTPDLWAGAASAALGVEARREELIVRVGALDQVKAFSFSNFTAFPSAKNTTKEAFSEVLLPLVRNIPALELFQLNGAARITSDHTGSVWSWKLGLTDQLFEGMQLRFSRSRDIRSPSLGELFTVQGVVSNVTISDPQTNTAYQIRTFGGGNPNLEPETSSTTAVGLTFVPKIAPALSLSVDYFDIDIADAIAGISPQNAITLCQNGFQSLCQTIIRGSDGLITTITANAVNFARISTKGFDASISYAHALPNAGRLKFRGTLTRVTEYETNNGFVTSDLLGSQGTVLSDGVPKLGINAAFTYEVKNIDAMIRSRYISSGLNNKTLSIQNNRIPAYDYIDLSAGYRLPWRDGAEFRISGTVTNLLDKEPPVASQFSPYYDVVGRYFSLGAELKF